MKKTLMLLVYQKGIAVSAPIGGKQRMYSSSPRERRTNLCAMGITICLLLSGCLVSSDINDRDQGKRIPSKTLKQFEPGVTTKEWTLAVLGSPSHREGLSDNKEIFRYDYSHKVNTNTSIFLLFDGSTNKTEKQTTYFEFDGDLLSRYWVEDD